MRKSREICDEDRIKVFGCPWMSKQLLARKGCDVPPRTLQEHLDKIRKLFTDHLPDQIGGLIYDSEAGGRFEITPQWQMAWRVAMGTLGRSWSKENELDEDYLGSEKL